ncbi:MAG TPA: hypothetical protein VF319_00285 [Caldimonas sp.]
MNLPRVEFEPRQVLLFSGHRVDVPGRVPARFPPEKVDRAGVAIARALDDLGAGPLDLALTQGSSGADLLFAEECLHRGVRLRLMQPGPEAGFIEESVRASVDGAHWVERYAAVRNALVEAPLALPAAPDAVDADRFERCNRWLLDTALSWGRERLRVMCLWDGAMSAERGGTAQLVEEVQRRRIPWIWLDARRL